MPINVYPKTSEQVYFGHISKFSNLNLPAYKYQDIYLSLYGQF